MNVSSNILPTVKNVFLNVWTKCLFLLFLGGNIVAQDIHFSQLEASPLNLNPAETGYFKADHRAVVNYRNQWASVTVPYKTFSASYENLQKKWLKDKAHIGLGLLFNSDVAGDGNMGTIQVKLSPALHYKPLLDSSLYISFGFNIAYNQHTLDYERLIFDNQYNGIQYDANIQSSENFSGEQFSFVDVSLGLRFTYYIKASIPLHLGLVFNHLNKSKQGFMQAKEDALKGKFNTYLSSDISLSRYWEMKPMAFYYRQGRYNELILGVLLSKKINDINFRYFNFGLFSRSQDALIFRIGMNYQSFDIGFSYDLNYSKLRVASHGVGAFEISLRALFFNPIRYEPCRNQQCPVFL